MADSPRWDLRPGDQIKRTVLHEKYGGGKQGGIAPSAQTPNVLIFSDPASGVQHGYIDGWEHGCFSYTGEGQRGDQVMQKGNAAILHHREDERALRIFDGTGGIVTYVDEFEIDPEQPFYTTDAPETGGGPIRSVIVFRLRPKTISPPAVDQALSPPNMSKVDTVPIEEHNTERAFVDPSREPYEAERRESLLVQQFKEFLTKQGKEVTRLRITPSGEAKPLFSDIYIQAELLLIEAKGTVERGAIRMALGQLLDYRRFVNDAHCAILLPSRPRADLISLIHSASVDLYIWEGGSLTILNA